MKWLFLCTAVWALACGDDGSEADSNDGGTSAGGSGAGGSSASKGGTAGRGGAGGAAQGGSSGESSGGSDDGVEAGAGGQPAPDCSMLTAGAIVGELDGTAIDEIWSIASGAQVPGDPWFIATEFDDRGNDFIRGAGPGDPAALDPETPLGFGILLAPSTSAIGEQVVCFDEGTASGPELPRDIRTTAARLLGACPGEPIAGELVLCTEGNPMCDQPVTGDLDGQALDGSGLFLYGGREAPDFSIQGRGDHLFVITYVEGDAPSMQTGAVEYGLIVTFPDGSTPGAVYCAGADSSYEWQTVNGTLLTLQNLSKLGDCDGGSDSLLLCR